MALIEMMIYSFEADGPHESLVVGFLLFLGSSPSICLFDTDGEREGIGVFVGGAGVISGESGTGVSSFISVFAAVSSSVMASASSAVFVAVFVCTGLRISASNLHLTELEDFFDMMDELWCLMDIQVK
jgi:hypothetical protein